MALCGSDGRIGVLLYVERGRVHRIHRLYGTEFHPFAHRVADVIPSADDQPPQPDIQYVRIHAARLAPHQHVLGLILRIHDPEDRPVGSQFAGVDGRGTQVEILHGLRRIDLSGHPSGASALIHLFIFLIDQFVNQAGILVILFGSGEAEPRPEQAQAQNAADKALHAHNPLYNHFIIPVLTGCVKGPQGISVRKILCSPFLLPPFHGII